MTQLQSTIELAGSPVVLAYSSIEAEYDALRRRAIVVNRSHRGRMVFSGEKAGEVLSGLVTNDVGALSVGQGQYAVALTAKGKVVSDMRILRLEEGFLTDASPRSREAWAAVVRKYVNPRLAKYADHTDSWSALGIYGSQARYVVEEMTGVGHSALALLLPYAHISLERDGVRLIVMRSPDLSVEGYDLFVPAGKFQDLWDVAVKSRATPGGHAVWEIARVEAGRPEYGVDMNDATIPQEANLEQLEAISFTKGCYTGQEVVARVHFRGHVNRALRGIRAAGTVPPPSGASLFDQTGKAVGDVRSSVTSPQLGGIALGMVRLEVEAGAALTARWSGGISGDSAPGEMAVNAVPLPFATT